MRWRGWDGGGVWGHGVAWDGWMGGVRGRGGALTLSLGPPLLAFTLLGYKRGMLTMRVLLILDCLCLRNSMSVHNFSHHPRPRVCGVHCAGGGACGAGGDVVSVERPARPTLASGPRWRTTTRESSRRATVVKYGCVVRFIFYVHYTPSQGSANRSASEGVLGANSARSVRYLTPPQFTSVRPDQDVVWGW